MHTRVCNLKTPLRKLARQIRRKGSYASNTFKRRADADTWALEAERNIDMGIAPKAVSPSKVHTLADIIDLHLLDMTEVGKVVRRSKAAVLAALKISMGKLKLKDLNRMALIDYRKKRAKDGAGPATLAIDFSFMGTLLTHAAAVHGKRQEAHTGGT